MAQKKGVLHVPGRVIRRKIERFEIVIVVLYLRTVGRGESHRSENRLDFLQSRPAGALRDHLLRGVPGLWHPVGRDDRLLHRGVAVVPLLALSLREPWRPVHHALAAPEGLLSRNETKDMARPRGGPFA